MIPNDEKQDAGDHKTGQNRELPLSKVAIYVLLGIGGLIILAAIVAVIITPPIARHNRDQYERVAMATLIEGVDVEVVQQTVGAVLPEVGVVAQAMHQDERPPAAALPLEVVDAEAVEL